jgi:hypothetical protein
LVRAIRLDFLGAGPFRCENPRWGVLDFLGFPRLNLVFSTGYADESGNDFFSALFRGLSSAGIATTVWHRGVQDFSWGKLNLVSDFLQDIVVRAAPFRLPRSKSNSLWPV